MHDSFGFNSGDSTMRIDAFKADLGHGQFDSAKTIAHEMRHAEDIQNHDGEFLYDESECDWAIETTVAMELIANGVDCDDHCRYLKYGELLGACRYQYPASFVGNM